VCKWGEQVNKRLSGFGCSYWRVKFQTYPRSTKPKQFFFLSVHVITCTSNFTARPSKISFECASTLLSSLSTSCEYSLSETSSKTKRYGIFDTPQAVRCTTILTGGNRKVTWQPNYNRSSPMVATAFEGRMFKTGNIFWSMFGRTSKAYTNALGVHCRYQNYLLRYHCLPTNGGQLFATLHLIQTQRIYRCRFCAVYEP